MYPRLHCISSQRNYQFLPPDYLVVPAEQIPYHADAQTENDAEYLADFDGAAQLFLHLQTVFFKVLVKVRFHRVVVTPFAMMTATTFGSLANELFSTTTHSFQDGIDDYLRENGVTSSI